MLEYVYVVQIVSKNTKDVGRISQEAYKTLSKAQNFIENRSDKPKKFTEYIYESTDNVYLIYKLTISD